MDCVVYGVRGNYEFNLIVLTMFFFTIRICNYYTNKMSSVSFSAFLYIDLRPSCFCVIAFKCFSPFVFFQCHIASLPELDSLKQNGRKHSSKVVHCDVGLVYA